MTRAAFISRDSQFSFLARHAPALLSLCHATAARLRATRTLFYGLFTFPTKEARASGLGGGRRLHKSWSVVQPPSVNTALTCSLYGYYGRRPRCMRGCEAPPPRHSSSGKQAGDELCR